MMKHTRLAAALIAVLGSASNAIAQDAEETGIFASQNFTSSIYLTTDYRFRGISNSDGPALQGSLDWTYNGWFAGVWGSNTEFSDSNVEIDFYGGYRWSAYGLDFTGQVLYYTFPGEDPQNSDGFDPPGYDPVDANLDGVKNDPVTPGVTFPGIDIEANYFEINFGVSKTFAEAPLSPVVGLGYYYSPDFFGEDGDGHNIQGNFAISLPFGFTAYATAGYQAVEGNEYSAFFATPNGYDYFWYNGGIKKTIKGFTLDLSYHGIDRDDACNGLGQQTCATLYPDGGIETFYNDYKYITENNRSYRDLTDGSLVFTISRTF